MGRLTTNERAITERVIRARQAADLQKQDVAAKLGLSLSGYSPYENFKAPFTLEQIFQLSRILGRPVEHFLGLDTGLTEDEEQLLATYRTIPEGRLKELARKLVRDMAPESAPARER